MPYIRDAINAHVQDNINKRVVDSFTTYSPIWYFLGAGATYDRKNPYKDGKAGRPSKAKFFGSGMGMSKAEKIEKLGSMDHQITFVKEEPDDGTEVSYGGSAPTPAGFAEDNAGTAEFRWTHFMEPLKFRKHSLQFAKGDTQVRSIVDQMSRPVQNRLFKRVSSAFWTGSLNAAQQNAKVWAGVIGIENQVNENDTWGRVDRSSETELNANVLAAGTDIGDGTAVSLDMIRKINHGFTKESGGDFEGIATKTTSGEGANCVITHPELYQSLASEAEGHYQIFQGGVPGSALGGFKRPIIAYDNTYVTYDPFCPSGKMFALNLGAWSLEVQQGYDWTFSGLQDNSKLQFGGDLIEWGHYEYMPRFICHAPHLQTVVTGLTAAV